MKIDIIQHLVGTNDHIEVTTYKPVDSEEDNFAEDLVHCGECKYYGGFKCLFNNRFATELDYCSWGERE